MKRISFESYALLGDMAAWRRQNGEDNASDLARMRRNLRRAREQALTPRQKEVIDLYYDEGMNIPQIAARLGVNRSSVSRTLRRAKERIYGCLRYTL